MDVILLHDVVCEDEPAGGIRPGRLWPWRQALTIGLVTRGAVGGIDVLAFRHEFVCCRDGNFGVMYGCIAVGGPIRRVL